MCTTETSFLPKEIFKMLDIACRRADPEEMRNCCVSAEAATTATSAVICFIMVCIFWMG